MTAIVDYDAGNICSVENALQRLGVEYALTDDPALISAASRVILPGVGNAARALESLRAKGLDEVIKARRKPVLGICVGMQILCRHCEEGDVDALALFDCNVRRFSPTPDCKVPHMGWNRICNLDGKLYKGMDTGEYVYFVHSYYPELCCDTTATCTHAGVMFSASLKYENFFGTQYHPEKSGDTGERILRNFLGI